MASHDGSSKDSDSQKSNEGPEPTRNPQPSGSKPTKRKYDTTSDVPGPSTCPPNRPGSPNISQTREGISADPEPSTPGVSKRSHKKASRRSSSSTSTLTRPESVRLSPPREEELADSQPSTSEISKGSPTSVPSPGLSTQSVLRPGSPRLSPPRERPSAGPQPGTSGTSPHSQQKTSNSPSRRKSTIYRPGPLLLPSQSEVAERGRKFPFSAEIARFFEYCIKERIEGYPLALFAKLLREFAVETTTADTEVIESNSYQYRDSEDLMTELAELYSYSEDETHYIYRAAFESRLTEFGISLNWSQLSDDQRVKIIMRLMGELQDDNEENVLNAVRAILYVAQGNWGDLATEAEHTEALRNNAIFLYRVGVFDGLVTLVRRQGERFRNSNSTTSESFRVMTTSLNILYTITEVMRHESNTNRTQYGDEIEAFRSDMATEADGELFIVTLFKLIAIFADCEIKSEGFPIKKMLLLLWKILLVSLGGLTELDEKKRLKRIQYNLEPDHVWAEPSDNLVSNRSAPCTVSPRKKPKIYRQDIEQFLRSAKKKHFISSPGAEPLPGLPQILRRNIEVMSKYVYTPLREKQIQEDRAKKWVKKNVSTKAADDNEKTTIEIFYRALYRKMDQYLLSLMKIVTFILYSKHRKIFSCKPNIAGVERITNDANSTYNTILMMDGRRYQAIMLKAISAILLLLLKHLKLNHIYQFEHMCRLLDGCNTLTLLVGFFRGSLVKYVEEINDVPDLDFPHNVFGNRERSQFESDLKENSRTSNRHMFICINLLRVINKLVKWKQFRLSEMITMESRTALTQCVRINNDMFKMYALKLLKMQLKHMSRDWWHAHINVINEIYSHVRLNLNDDYLVRRPFPAGDEDRELDQLINAINEYIIPKYGDPFEPSDDDEDQDVLNVDNCLMEFSGDDPKGWVLPECLLEALFRWMQREFLS